MRRMFLAGMITLLALGGCGKTATLLMNGNLPAGTSEGGKEKFDGGQYWIAFRPYQNSFSGNVYGGEQTYQIRNTTQQDICVGVRFIDDLRGNNASTYYGLKPSTILVPGRSTVVAATAQARTENDGNYVTFDAPSFIVERQSDPVDGACFPWERLDLFQRGQPLGSE